MSSLTAASALITLSIAGLFTAPQQLQGFAVDDIYDVDALDITETMMGVDGILSGGFVYNPIKQAFSIQSDSPSIAIFETWAAAQAQQKDVFTAQGYTALPAVGRSYRSTKGFLTQVQPIPSAGKLLKARKFTITWESILSVPN